MLSESSQKHWKQKKLKNQHQHFKISIFSTQLSHVKIDNSTNSRSSCKCQRLYQKSDLLMLLLICLWDSAFDIWFDKQTIMRLTSLNEWIEILRVDFANVSFAKVKTSKMICMRCDWNFNFKNKLREHVREQHAKKFVKSSFLSVDTLNIFIATSKHKFEFVMIFETINSSKNSHLTSNASEIVSKSMKNESNQCFFAQMFSFFRTLEIKHQDICVQKSSKFCSSLTSFTLNLVCEASKKSTIASSFSVSLATSSKLDWSRQVKSLKSIKNLTWKNQVKS